MQQVESKGSRKAKVKQSDLVRILNGVRQSGLAIRRVIIQPSGAVDVECAAGLSLSSSEENEWDSP